MTDRWHRGPLRRWWVRAGLRSALAPLPGSSRLEEYVRLRTSARLSPGYALGKWRHVLSHVELGQIGATGRGGGDTGRADLAGARVVELGTGWYPLVPIGLALHGADVVSIDTTPHLSPSRAIEAAAMLGSLITDGRIEVPDQDRAGLLLDLASRSAKDGEVETVLRRLGVSTAVADAQDLRGVPSSHGADLFVSNNTIEHIPEPVLAGIFTEFVRVATEHSRMSHYVDMADHYAATDPQIGVFNFLTVPPRRWAMLNSRLHYQNRMRLSDHLRVLERSGWAAQVHRAHRGDAEELAGLADRLVEPFAAMSPEDLVVIRAHLVATVA